MFDPAYLFFVFLFAVGYFLCIFLLGSWRLSVVE